MRTFFLLCVSAGALAAQIGLPGQYPQPQPGRYPGGGPGNNGPGIPVPSRGSRKSTSDKADAPVPRAYNGVIRKLDEKSLDLELADTRYLIIQISSTTTKPDLKTGDGVEVTATQNDNGEFQAISIKPNPEIARTINANDELPTELQERTGPPPTILVSPSAANDPGDGEPPKLKRGKPPARASAPEPRQEAAAAPVIERAELPPAVDTRQAFIDKAREVAGSFLEGLPNYVCQEVTTRYASETRVPSWNALDVVSAEVVFDSGKETYRNLTINGKPSKKSPEESGAWSTGEFGTILAALFAPGTDAKFKFTQAGSMAHHPASIYDFQVERLRSNWRIHVPGQYIIPAHKGSVWIDKESAHALRIEMQAKDVPSEFPLITAETAVDYDYVSLGTPDKFLLPVHAEVLSCLRGSNQCERNSIDFRNYHKFAGESTIKFNDQ